MRTGVLLVLIAAALALPGRVNAAHAQQSCGDRADYAKQLGEQYGESVQARGLDTRGFLMELWANLDTGTWTFATTSPGGSMCLLSAGDNYDPAPTAPEPAGQGA